MSLLLCVGTAISHFKELGDTPTSHCLVVFHSEGEFRKLDCGLGFSMGEEVKVKEQMVGTEGKKARLLSGQPREWLLTLAYLQVWDLSKQKVGDCVQDMDLNWETPQDSVYKC